MTENTSEETFCFGDIVVWQTEKMQYARAILINEHGEGPFEIIKVENVPDDQCACGQTLGQCKGSGDRRIPPCQKSMREAVGHHQFVYISKDKKTIVAHISKKPEAFSGALFKKI